MADGDLVKRWQVRNLVNYGVLLHHTDESLVDDTKWFFSSGHIAANGHPKNNLFLYSRRGESESNQA